MGPYKKPLPSCEWALFVSSLLLIVAAGIETSIYQPGKVRCKYCKGRSGNPWFLAKNVPGHLACASHLKSAKEEQVRRETREQLDHLRTQDHERFRQTGFQYVQLSHPRQPEVPVPMNPSPEIGEQEMWEDFELDRSSTSLLDAARADRLNPMERQEVDFYQTLDRADRNCDTTAWDLEEFDVECDVDETLTNIMRDLGQ
jgi:hypothetical protein